MTILERFFQCGKKDKLTPKELPVGFNDIMLYKIYYNEEF